MKLSAPSARALLFRRLARIFVVLLALVLSVGFIVVPLELREEHRHIHSVFDGVWWAMGAITMVGYGDVIPVTQGGRILAMFLQMAGVLLLGSIAGVMVTHFHHVESDHRWKNLREKLERVEDELDDIKSKLDFLVKHKDAGPKKPPRWGL